MFTSPMLLYKAPNNLPFDSALHLTELKLDGIRLIVDYRDKVKIYTRHNNDVTAKFPELVKNIPIQKGSTLDGELIVTDSDGKPNFESIMERFMSKKSRHKVTFCAFDIVNFEGKSVTSKPLIERKEILSNAFVDNEYYAKSIYIRGNGIEYFSLAKQQKLEGIVLKDIRSKYEIDKRSDKWLKVIAYEVGEYYIAGYKKNEFGWILSDGKRIVGVMSLAVGTNERKAGYRVFQQLKKKETEDTVYIDPVIKCVVKHRGYTKNNFLRLPEFEGFVF
ncbi:RNA ligase family protein [Paenibacillus xylanexedens]|uniref:ATP-dependent DNA ligase n=1 Tax=Paenibacillus xylanexedens TaxID=528191 RepID=UPI000FA2910B|nr:RNA ligase family protein [Paenibacillus xylanexedens]RPK31770.1 ATP-dependent DNA ligase [Paenibacillus xylanexedens]